MKVLFIIGAINGFLAVALGAFGAHGLEGKISENALKTWEKAVNYQMFHTVSILLTGILLLKTQSSTLLWAGWMFVVGILLFSGSLYLYSTSGVRTLAMITPFGGVAFLIGWILLGYGLIKVL
ncbi:DUF423 domain-containing protein [Pseudogracilibacillus sp. SO30301A]|uniref:DUF423 domain-containing protein n=1 Tax=Pseudogracilibacillus sp. SO30301A TaxID=3098291 RepID=UPI00300E688F